MKMRGMKTFGLRGMARGMAMAIAMAALMVTTGITGAARAAVVTYTDVAAFNAAISGAASSSTLNFDGSAPGTLIADGGALGGLTFDYGPLSAFVTLEVNSGNDTTSGANYLGTTDAGVFLGFGDAFTLTFGAANAVGMFFITGPDQMFDGDLSLSVGGDTASLVVADIVQTLPDTGQVFFLGLVDDTNTFTSADVASIDCGGCFLWNVDDITTATLAAPIPLPPALPLFAAGLAGLWGLGRRRKQRQA